MTPRQPLPTWKKAAASALILVTFFGLLELGARLLVEEHSVAVQADHERLIDVMGLPALNQTMRPDPHLFWRLRDSLRGIRVAGKVRGAPVSFTVSTHDGLRNRPVVAPKLGARILALGDSTTFGLGADDDDTWPVQLQRLFEAQGQSVEVINAGVPGYTAFQGARYLRARGMALEPDLVIATFGFNDKEEWSARSDYESALYAAYGGVERYLFASRLYYGLRMAWSARLDASRRASSPGQATEAGAARVKRPRLTPDEYVAQLSDIKAQCDARKVALALILWPLAAQVHAGDRPYAFYQQHAARFCREQGVPCIDMLDRFVREKNTHRRWPFVDHIHVGKVGNSLVADEVLRSLADHEW